MKPSSIWRGSLTALVLVSGLGAVVATPVIAQDFGRSGAHGPRSMQPGGAQMPFAGALFSVACHEDAAARIEAAAEDVATRLEVTDAQAELLATLTADALEAQASFADACADTPAASGSQAGDRDLIDRLTARQEIAQVRLDAMAGVLPALEAFHESLTEEQRALLVPERGERGDRGRPHSVSTPGSEDASPAGAAG